VHVQAVQASNDLVIPTTSHHPSVARRARPGLEWEGSAAATTLWLVLAGCVVGAAAHESVSCMDRFSYLVVL
jgi:hypothetical protein